MTTLTNRPGTALLVIDMQRDFVQHGHDVDNVTANIKSLVTKRYGEQITRESSIESART